MTDVYEVPADRVAARVLDGEAVVINLDSGVYVGLNAPATALWGLLETAPRGHADLAGALAQAHGAPADEVQTDVGLFLADLAEVGLVVPAAGAAEPAEPLAIEGRYLAPIAERYDTLDELMLSGE